LTLETFRFSAELRKVGVRKQAKTSLPEISAVWAYTPTMDSTDFNEMSWAGWMTPVDDEPTRESWLLSAIDRMARSLFPAFKPPKFRWWHRWIRIP